MYGVTQSDIVKLNPGSDEKIFVGRTLRIPRTAANTQTETFHTIAQGETLYRLPSSTVCLPKPFVMPIPD